MHQSAFEPPPQRRVFCNRTLNMRSIQAVGFDMDYTLVHYDVPRWEARAYAHVQQRLLERGHAAVRDLRFQVDLFARGLILDVHLGNIVKANRFGYVIKAAHGTRMLSFDEHRKAYSQAWVDLAESRWVFLNTLFSLSEACLYAQIVDLHDRGQLARGLGYAGIYELVRDTMDAAHLEGALKAEIIAAPEHYVELDPDLPRALLDLRQAGKKLFLATNSEWPYTVPMMRFAFDRFLGRGGWRDLFDLVIVQSKKPAFFDGEAPFRALDDHGNELPGEARLQPGRCYRGGNAQALQKWLGCNGEAILYVGDHVYADVHVSSRIRRWRTALVLRELEHEVAAEQSFAGEQRELQVAMAQKERLEQEQSMLRLSLQRLEHGNPLPPTVQQNGLASATAIHERLRGLRTEVEQLDHRIAPLAIRASELGHPRWGPLMRSGNDKSRLARQIERYADVYTSRVSNLLYLTPFGYLRAPRGSLPHDGHAADAPPAGH
jgi:HAD superfamily 5'-nucleotidase-like hydrolase